MRGEHAVSMSTAFNGKITGFGIESNLCILRDQIGVQIITSDVNRSIVRQPLAGDVDFSEKNFAQSHEGNSSSGRTPRLIPVVLFDANPGLRLNPTVIVDTNAFQSNGSTGPRCARPGSVSTVCRKNGIRLNQNLACGLQPKGPSAGTRTFRWSRSAGTTAQQIVQGSVSVNLGITRPMTTVSGPMTSGRAAFRGSRAGAKARTGVYSGISSQATDPPLVRFRIITIDPNIRANDKISGIGLQHQSAFASSAHDDSTAQVNLREAEAADRIGPYGTTFVHVRSVLDQTICQITVGVSKRTAVRINENGPRCVFKRFKIRRPDVTEGSVRSATSPLSTVRSQVVMAMVGQGVRAFEEDSSTRSATCSTGNVQEGVRSKLKVSPFEIEGSARTSARTILS